MKMALIINAIVRNSKDRKKALTKVSSNLPLGSLEPVCDNYDFRWYYNSYYYS